MNADAAMYTQEGMGKTTSVLFEASMNVAPGAPTCSCCRPALRGAERELVLYISPICANSGAGCCAEALLRWQHPAKRPVVRRRFYQHGGKRVIVELDSWACARACRVGSVGTAEGPSKWCVAVTCQRCAWYLKPVS